MSVYRTIAIDPPWDYETDKGWKGRRGCTQYQIAPRYTLMSLADLEAFGERVNAVADPNGSSLFMWTTNAFMHDAYHLLDTWGWGEPRAIGVWVKSEAGMGMGRWVRNDAEYWLWATRGNVTPPERPESNIIRAGTNGHSVKPAAFYDMVERISPGPFLDMFGGRNTLRFNWDCWGDGK